MSRKEFSKQTKREALKRSERRCEAKGRSYGLEPGQRCNMPLDRGVEFDHIILEANSHDNSIENCAAVCVRCHGIKTTKHDIPLAAKTVRQRDKFDSTTRTKRPWSKYRKKMNGTVELREPKSRFDNTSFGRRP